MKAVRSLSRLLLIVLFVAAPASRPFAQQPYTNPVVGDPQKPGGGIADPFILKWNGEYYLYCTGDPITAYHSTDLVNWSLIGPVLSSSGKPDAWNQTDVWAPEVVYRNGKFYLYYTAAKKSDDWRVVEMTRRIGVAVSDSPRGPFLDSLAPVTPGWGIDGHVFKEPDTGEEFHFYSYLDEPRWPGAGIVVDRMLDWNKQAGQPARVARGTEAWEDKDGDPNNGSLRYTTEGPAVLKRHGKYYMTYSGGSWDLPTYSMAYAVSDRLVTGDLDGPGWRKVVPPILRSTPFVEAPGHNAIVKAPNNVDDIVAYHARVVPFRGPGDRLTFVDRLYWNHDRMFMQQPTLAELAPPDRPLFSDLFNRADGAPGEAWQALGGEWRVAGNQLRQAQAKSGRTTIIPRAERLTHYVFEANVKSAEANRAMGAGVGVAAWYADEQNRVDVWLDRDDRLLLTGGKLKGANVEVRATPLPPGFRFDAYHQLLITKNAGALTVALDGVRMQTREFDLGAGTVGLQTLNTQADFDGVALTAFYEDSFDGPGVTWAAKGGTWTAEEGALHQVAGGAGRAVALKGDAAENYEFTASVRVRDADATTSIVGVVAAANDADEMVLAGFDKNIWPFARFHVRRVVNGEVKDSLSVEMPRGFLYDQFHTIRVVKQGGALTFFLDGKEAAAARFPLGASRPGVFTEGVRAAFDNCAMKRTAVAQNLLLNGSFETDQWGADAASNPWKLAGKARGNYCCAHTGLWRLAIAGGDGEANQSVSGLAPGRYVLSAWVMTNGGAEAEVSAAPFSAAAGRVTASGEKWTRVKVEFDVAAGHGAAGVRLRGLVKPDTNGSVAFDDVYLAGPINR
jgi:GH43 family beta-xylosidase